MSVRCQRLGIAGSAPSQGAAGPCHLGWGLHSASPMSQHRWPCLPAWSLTAVSQHPTASPACPHHGTLFLPHSEAVGTVLLESTRPLRDPFFTSSPGSCRSTQLYFLSSCQVPRGCSLTPPLPSAESQNCSHILWLSPQPQHEVLTSL